MIMLMLIFLSISFVLFIKKIYIQRLRVNPVNAWSFMNSSGFYIKERKLEWAVNQRDEIRVGRVSFL